MKNNSELQRNLANSKKSNERLKENYADALENLNDLNSKNDSLTQRIKNQQAQILNLENALSESELNQSYSSDLINEINRYKEKLFEAKSVNDVNAEKLDEYAAETKKKEKKLNELESKLKIANDNEQLLRQLLSKSENMTISKDAYTILKSKLDETVNENEILNEKLIQNEEKIKSMHNQFVRIKRENEELSGNLDDAFEELRQLNATYKKNKEENDGKTSQIRELNQRINETEDDLARLRTTILEKQKQINELNQKLEQLNEINEELRTQNDELERNYSKISQSNKQLEKERVELEHKTLQDSKQILSLKASLDRAGRKKNDEGAERNDVRLAIQQEQKKLNEANKKLLELTSKDQSQLEIIENLSNENEDLIKELNEKEARLTKSERLLNEKEHCVINLDGELNLEKRKIISLSNKLKTSENENKKLTASIQNSKSTSEKLLNDLKLVKNEINDYKTKLVEVSDENDDLKTKLDDLEKDSLTLIQLKTETKSEFDELVDKYQVLAEKYNLQKEEFDKKSSTLEKLEKTKKSAITEKEVLKAEVDTVSGKLNALNAALDRSRIQRQQLLDDLNKSKQKTAELEEAGEESKQAIVKR